MTQRGHTRDRTKGDANFALLFFSALPSPSSPLPFPTHYIVKHPAVRVCNSQHIEALVSEVGARHYSAE